MDLRPYQAFFHDGYVNCMKTVGDVIKIWMTSSVLTPEFNMTDIEFDADNSITGCIVAYNVSVVKINDIETEFLNMEYDDGEIEHLEISSNSIKLSVTWVNYKSKTSIYEEIYIVAEYIDWINGATH